MSLYRRGRMWCYRFRFTLKHPDGRREHFEIRRSAHTRNRREAEETEQDHRRALRKGDVHPRDPWPPVEKRPRTPTLREFSGEFLTHVRLHTKPSTAGFYEQCLARLLAFAPLAESPLAEIGAERVDGFIAWRQAQRSGTSLSALNGELRTLRRLLYLAEEWKVVDRAPKVHELPGEARRERVVTFAEEARYLRAASATLRQVAILAVDTGLRPNSELFRLEWRHVHLDGQPPYIHVAEGKSREAVRNVPLTARARSVLTLRRGASQGSVYVFGGPGRCGHLTSVQHAHERAVRRAGLKAFEFYCWRHTFATRCAESGMDKFTLARLLGHSSPRVTERYYVHVTEPHVAAGFERFAAYLAERQIGAVPEVTQKVQ